MLKIRANTYHPTIKTLRILQYLAAHVNPNHCQLAKFKKKRSKITNLSFTIRSRKYHIQYYLQLFHCKFTIFFCIYWSAFVIFGSVFCWFRFVFVRVFEGGLWLSNKLSQKEYRLILSMIFLSDRIVIPWDF